MSHQDLPSMVLNKIAVPKGGLVKINESEWIRKHLHAGQVHSTSPVWLPHASAFCGAQAMKPNQLANFFPLLSSPMLSRLSELCYRAYLILRTACPDTLEVLADFFLVCRWSAPISWGILEFWTVNVFTSVSLNTTAAQKNSVFSPTLTPPNLPPTL